MRGGVWVLSALIVVGCAGSGGGDGDDAVPAAELVFRAGGELVSELDFAGVVIGSIEAITVVVTNEGDAASSGLALAVSDAAFRTDGGCDGAALEPGASCEVRVSFTPDDSGPSSAQLTVQAAEVSAALGLAGSGVPVQGLVLDPAGFDFGLVEVGTTAAFGFRVLDRESAPPDDVAIAVTGDGFRLLSTTCGAEMAGTSCDVIVEVAPATLGALVGGLSVTSSLGGAQANLAATGAGRVTVSAAGEGAGSIVSSPPGIECGAICTGLFVGAVTLTAAGGTGSAFAGWDGACGAQASCEVAVSAAASSLAATFDLDPAFRRIALAFAGGAPGEVDWQSGDLGGACTGSCKIVVPAAATVVMQAVTPATFGGWAGICEGTASRCEVVLGESVDGQVTFSGDDAAIAIGRLPVATRGLAYHPGGHLILSDGSHVTRVTEDGRIVWSTALDHPAWDTSRVAGLRTDGAGDVYLLIEEAGAMHLHRLRGTDGAEEWSASLAAVTGSEKDFNGYLAVGAGGRAAVLGWTADGGLLRFYNPSGTVSWSETGLPFPRALAISPAGILHAAVESDLDPDFSQVLRFDLDGEELPGITLLPGFYSTSLAVGADEFVVASTYGHDDVTVSRLSPDGESVFEDLADLVGLVDHAVEVDPSGRVIAIRDRDSFSALPGYHLRQLSAEGALLWEVDKPAQEGLLGDAGAEPVGLAASRDGRVAVAYAFVATALSGAWVTIFQP